MKSVAFILFSIFALTFTSCPNGSIGFQNSCYIFYSNASQFMDAELNCTGINGHLVSVHTGFINAFLTSESSNHFHESTVTDFWVGLNSLMIPGNWSWTDNTNFDFKEWAPGEPQNLTQSCGTIAILNGYWASDDCFKTKPYVCEVPNIVLTTTAPTVYPVYMNCSMGWTYFEPTHSCYGHDWYGVVTSNWTTAEKYCETQTQKAHLVSIHSYDEMKFVSSLISFSSYYSWSGLYSVDDEKTWKWSDGSPVDYLPWQSGYPNRNVSSCAAVWVEMFADHPCDLIMATLCKRPAFT